MGRARGSEAGGISGLVALIERDGPAVDADLQRFYGLSLNDVAAGRLTFRRLRDLLAELPSEGTALRRRALKGAAESGQRVEPPADLWNLTNQLLAQLIDQSALRLWQAGGGKGQKPKPLPRPGVTDMKRTGTPMPAANVLRLLRPGVAGDGAD